LYLDESGFNLHTTSNYGYSPKNVPAKLVVPANRGRNISLLMIISNVQILHYKLIVGSYNSTLLMEFLEECFERRIISSSKIILMDNVKFHKTLEVKNFLLSKSIIFDYLPPYSPSLNPIEEVFSCLKNRLYSIRPIANSQNNLITNINEVIASVNADETHNFNNYYENMRNYIYLTFQSGFF
jgi:transposase